MVGHTVIAIDRIEGAANFRIKRMTHEWAVLRVSVPVLVPGRLRVPLLRSPEP